MIQLREHQQEAHMITRQNIAAGETRMILEMATGTGKSFTQAALLHDQAEDGDQVQAAFVPTQDLVSQNARSYRRYFETMGKEVNIIGVFAPNEDIMREGLDTVTTSPEGILGAMDPSKANIVIGSYASSPAVEEACALGLKFDNMLCDEAHRMASGKGEQDAGVWSTPLFDDKIPSDKRVFYTATMRTDGPDDEVETIAMNNQELFGRRIYNLGYEEAVKRKLLHQYQPIPVEIERAQIEAAMAEAGIVRADDETDGVWRGKERAFAAALMSRSALENRRAMGEPLSMLTLHPNRARAEEYTSAVAKSFEQMGENVPVMTVHGQATDKKEEALSIGRSLHGEMACSVVDMFREGTDMPGANTLMVARNSQSSILLTQALGRVVRLYDNDWADENGNLPQKTPQVYVPVIVDSRDPNDRPDCALAANLFSAMLRMDDGARKEFEQACEKEGSDELMGLDEVEEKETSRSIASIFKLDTSAPTTKSLVDAIAQETRAHETIGQFDRMAGMYQAYMNQNNFEPPRLPSKSEWTSAQDADKPGLETRKRLALWQQSVSSKYANKTLLPEQADKLHKMEGFPLDPERATPQKLVSTFEAFESYEGRRPGLANHSKRATMEGQLSRFVKEGAMLSMEGQRKDATGKALRGRAGDKTLSDFAQMLTVRQAARGQMPAVFGGNEGVTSFKASVEMVEDPVSGQSRRCLVPEKGENVLGTNLRANKFQPALPVSLVEDETQKKLLSEIELGAKVVLSASERKGGIQLRALSRQEPAKVLPRWEALAQVLEAQEGDAKAWSSLNLKGKEEARPKGVRQVKGWETKTNRDLVNEVGHLRTQFAMGKLTDADMNRFEKVSGFAWMEPSDINKTIGVGNNKKPKSEAVLDAFVKRYPQALESAEFLSQDSAGANTAKAAMSVLKQAARFRKKAVEGGEAASGAMKSSQKLRRGLGEHVPMVKGWFEAGASNQQAAPVQDKIVEKKRLKSQAER